LSNEEYRNALIAAEQKSQDDYDKTIVTLSGGALGISVVFIKDIIGNSDPVSVWAVITAWSLWAASITSVVISYYLSREALRTTILQTDNNDFSGGVGGCSAKATQVFNAISGILFVVGIVFLIIFTANNLGTKDMSDDKKEVPIEKSYVPPPAKDPQPLTEGVIPPPPPPPPPAKDGE
jgi:hypothetical protein